jgi:NAD(P)-dependent dehydrogenase (short-subunit alcohol dehydrogenase family)
VERIAVAKDAHEHMAADAQLRSKVAIVTGGSRGIGLAVAESLLAGGASVVITGLDEEHLEKASRQLAGAGRGEPRLEAVRADIQVRADVDRLVERTVQRFGGLDILVNNAGIGVFSPVAELSDEDWRRVLDTNVTGVFYACRAAIPHLRARGGGWIINIGSLAGKNPLTGGGAYCASKAALNAFSEVLMQEVRHDGIRVSYVMPGSVATSFSGDESRGADWKIAPDDVAEIVLSLLRHHPRSLPSRVEIRPSKPRK